MNEETVTILTLADRLRLRKAQRLSRPQHFLDLQGLSAHLLNEDHPSTNGHRQMTLFHHKETTVILFAFEAGGRLPDHKANGLVTIQAMDGAFTIEAQNETEDADWQTHKLGAQQILVLNPGVLHNVTAHEASRMLLTIHLTENAAATP